MDHATHNHRSYIPAMGQDRLIGVYDLFARLAGVTAAHRYLIDQAEIVDGQDVLEIGCGTGNLLLSVKRRYPGGAVTGLDPDPRALTGARRKATRRGLSVRLDEGFADELPYPDASIDRVLSALMYHHLEEDQKVSALREAHRVLRPGGQLHLLDFVGEGHRHRRIAERTAHTSAESITSTMRTAGFAEAAVTGSVPLRLRLGHCLTFSGTR